MHDSINQPLSPHALPTLDDQPWEPISPRYRIVLGCRIALLGVAVTIAPWIPVLLSNHPPGWLSYFISCGALAVLALLLLVWVPRRVRRTQYLLRELDLHLRSGLWWYRTVSVATNRIQHLEITQGPVERLCGLTVLVIYTAGGFQSDLKIPGLESDLAHRIKAHLSQQTAEEEPVDGSE